MEEGNPVAAHKGARQQPWCFQGLKPSSGFGPWNHQRLVSGMPGTFVRGNTWLRRIP